MKSIILCLIALMTVTNVSAKKCFKYKVCAGDTVYVTVMGIHKVKVETLNIGRVFEDFIFTDDSRLRTSPPFFVYKTRGHRHIGKIHRDNKTGRLYKVLAVSIKGGNDFIARDLKTKELKNIWSYNSPYAPLKSKRPKVQAPSWSLKSKANESGIVTMTSSVTNRRKSVALNLSCNTMGTNNQLSLQLNKEVLNTELLKNAEGVTPEITVSFIIKGKGATDYSSNDYEVTDDAKLTKQDELPQEVVEAFKSGQSLKVQVTARDEFGQNKTLLGQTNIEIPLLKSSRTLKRMQNICAGVLD